MEMNIVMIIFVFYRQTLLNIISKKFRLNLMYPLLRHSIKLLILFIFKASSSSNLLKALKTFSVSHHS